LAKQNKQLKAKKHLTPTLIDLIRPSGTFSPHPPSAPSPEEKEIGLFAFLEKGIGLFAFLMCWITDQSCSTANN